MTDLRGLGALAGLTDEDPILAEQEQLPPDEDEAERAVRDHTTAGETRGPSDGNDPNGDDQDLAEAVAEGVLSDRPESPDAVGDMPAADDVRHEG